MPPPPPLSAFHLTNLLSARDFPAATSLLSSSPIAALEPSLLHVTPAHPTPFHLLCTVSPPPQLLALLSARLVELYAVPPPPPKRTVTNQYPAPAPPPPPPPPPALASDRWGRLPLHLYLSSLRACPAPRGAELQALATLLSLNPRAALASCAVLPPSPYSCPAASLAPPHLRGLVGGVAAALLRGRSRAEQEKAARAFLGTRAKRYTLCLCAGRYFEQRDVWTVIFSFLG
ncbi:hypothetical protein TeGR_g5863 [Tetraparma gracilis]|uniref:Uncharacterized protein n=1 Tax=Tetraparma gracilis TaxID=2962635 RepID=A0ABQ6M8H1_9STRA|nr:hypothetical protein TeGR_g5863 [Tetraparma gracilis]